MLATLVIGLREGLEAALIVGIIAAFLRKNGKSLTAMWLGVLFALVLSLAVGVGLDLVEQALPQASQEGMESVIGAIAIFFVTGMIVWMNSHASGMKKELEAEAAQALSQGSAYALAIMAFLAVLKEGFETAVFLLATFSAAQSAVLAASGAIIGVLLAVVIGWGIYIGGVRLNLSRFFRFTGAFLILVAGGLVITALRTAHEAGWLNAGQEPTVNLSWLVAPGTVQSALITGVLGIPADPRLIEVLGWFAYLVPVILFVFWPSSRRPRRHAAVRLQFTLAAALVAVAVALAIGLPTPRAQPPAAAMIVATSDASQSPLGTARLSADTLTVSLKDAGGTVVPLPQASAAHDQHDGIDASAWTIDRTMPVDGAPKTLTLDQVVTLSGGRVPMGLNPRQHPGPFDADWSVHRTTRVWAAEGMLLDATEESTTLVAVSGSGLETPRTLTTTVGIGTPLAPRWQVTGAYVDQAVAELNRVAAARTERLLWAVQLPIALGLVAFLLVVAACRRVRRLSRAPAPVTRTPMPHAGHRAGTSI
ncbi:iron uptake transporter permease EfeU [Acidisoma cladoniae]|uniref:iron uptake transporter permease EfeU n=1 Tax=Acidisoma cladoniae TaxID=3040935 RepID=UPI00254F4E29|nr:iron uptake transporter permease EfeU [Acidisoma sp. PAMC 29798]